MQDTGEPVQQQSKGRSSPLVTHHRERSGSRPRAAPCWYSSCPETRWARCSRVSQEPLPGLSCRGWVRTPTRSVLLHLTGMQESHHSGSARTPRQGISRGRPARVYASGAHTQSSQQETAGSEVPPRPGAPPFQETGVPPGPDPTGRLTPLTCRPGVWVGATCKVRDESVPAGG